MILVGDIGGTNTRLALARRDGTSWTLDALKRFPTPRDLASLIVRYRASLGSVTLTGAAFCGAGPHGANGSLQLTNCDTRLDPPALRDASGVPGVAVLNDFEAVAWSLTALRDGDRQELGSSGAIDPAAPRVVLGAGTGLGVASLVPHGADWSVLPGEGGHTDLAPVDEAERDVWNRLRTDLGRVTAEHVFSGPGLERLHVALHGGEKVSAPTISTSLLAGEARARRTVSVFSRWIGRFAGNLALTFSARGGIYLAGGIIPGWGAHFDAQAFREGFEDKAPFGSWMRQVPTYAIVHPQPGLLGLAAIGTKLFSR